MANQTKTFMEEEGDNYFRRNKATLESAAAKWGEQFSDIDWIHHCLAPFRNEIGSILEVGCANGSKLARICNLIEARGSGIDPSQLAVAEGNRKLGDGGIELHAGTASKLPFENQSFDLVYFGFCLYLVDRQDLLPAVAEADRVLRNGGFLAITDFDPIHQHKRPYHHKAGVFSFKQDYSKLFTASGMYSLVAKTSFSHHQPSFDPDGNERVSTTLLFKEMDAYSTVGG